MSNADLIERLEKAESGSGELDYLIEQAISDWKNLGGGWERHKVTGEERRSFSVSPNYTTSLDAIVALIGEKLPGHTWDAGARFYGEDWDLSWARVYPHRDQSKGTGNQKAATTPLALCIVLLKALDQGNADG